MKLIKKLFKLTVGIIAVLIILTLVLFYSPSYYKYIYSIEDASYRYSIYEYSLWEVHQLLIFKHNLNYDNYRWVEQSQVSLNVSNKNIKDIYLYHIYLDDLLWTDFKLELIDNKYIQLKNNNFIYFLYDGLRQEILYEAKNENQWIMEI